MLSPFTLCGLVLCGVAGTLAVSSAAPIPEVQLNREWAEAVFSDREDIRLPFSFVYGGVSSHETAWEYECTEKKLNSTTRQRTLTLKDLNTALEVRAVVNIYTDTPGVDWTIYFTNKGKTDTPIIEQVKAVDISVPCGEGVPVLHRLRGSTCTPEDWSSIDEPLPIGKRVEFGAQNGRSSAECPFFDIQYAGGGVVAAIGWSGQWRATVERQADGHVALQSGMEFLHTTLRPGETIRSPRVMLLYWKGDDQFQGCNFFRRTMLAHITPRIAGKTITPIITNCAAGIPTSSPGLFGGYYMNWTEAQAFDELKAMEGLGFEYFWTDAYFMKDNFPDGIGNYGMPVDEIAPDPVRFPHGLKPLSEAARKQGLKFLVWFEPERVSKGTYIAKNHPQYVIFDPTEREGAMGRYYYNLFDLGNPEARKYMTNFLMTAIKEYKMDCLRIDFNLDPLPLWQLENAKDPNRVGISEIRYNEGNYKMWDDILAAFPNLFIDNCASGGRRIDLETCSRSIPLWRTDGQSLPSIALNYNQSSLQNQAMAAGLNRYVPFSTGGQVIEKLYDFRSGFNAGIVVWSIPTESTRDTLKGGIAEGKRLRRYWFGNYYPLTEVTTSPKDWQVNQYHLPDTNEGVVIAFRRHESDQTSHKCNLREIDPKASYEVHRSYTSDRAPAVTMTGAELAQLLIEIPDKPSSVVIEYRKRL